MPDRWTRAVAAILLAFLFSCGGGGGGGAPATRPVVVTQGVAYEDDDPPLRLDAYVPEHDEDERLPALVFLYGGGWIAGDRSEESGIADAFAAEGYATFVPDYHLATDPAHRYPRQFADVAHAVRWLKVHADAFAIDPEKICVIGVSAGGHLANLLASTEGPIESDPEFSLVSSRPTCAVSIAGPTDLTATFPPPLDAIIPEVFHDVPLESASPLYLFDRLTPPVLLIHGNHDELVPFDQSQRFAEALLVAGRPVSLVSIDSGNHALDVPGDQAQVKEALDEFLRSSLLR